jgi:hypothetical protein
MFKKVLLLLLLLLGGARLAFAQAQQFPNAPSSGTGAPTGTCTSGSLYTDTSTGSLYTCQGGAWTLNPRATAATTATNATNATTAANLSGGGNVLCKTFENIQCVDAANSQGWSGSDAGAWINAAYANLASTGGIIMVAAGTYTITTPIVFGTNNKPALLQCAPSGATTLNYTPTTGTAFLYNAGQAHKWSGGLQGCTLNGPSSSGSTTGIMLGGTNGAEGVIRRDVKVTNFGLGETYGNNAFLAKCDHCVFINNGQNLEIPSGLTNSGESINYEHTAFANDSGGASNANCVKVDSTANNLTFTNGSFDNCQYTQNAGQVAIVNTHFEDPNAGMTVPFVQMNGGRLSLDNPDMLWADVPPTPSAVVGCSSGVLSVNGASFFSTNTLGSDLTFAGNCEFHETATKLSSGFTNFLVWGSTGAYSTFGNVWGNNVLVGAGDLLLSGSRLKLGPLNLNYYTFVPSNPVTFRNIAIVDPGMDMTMGVTLNTGSGAYQSARGQAGCTTPATTAATCSVTMTWPHAFAGTNYSVTCTPTGGPTGFPSAPWVTTKTTTTALVSYQTNNGAAAAWAFIDCIGVVD